MVTASVIRTDRLVSEAAVNLVPVVAIDRTPCCKGYLMKEHESLEIVVHGGIALRHDSSRTGSPVQSSMVIPLD